jgi:hypothetical protein
MSVKFTKEDMEVGKYSSYALKLRDEYFRLDFYLEVFNNFSSNSRVTQLINVRSYLKGGLLITADSRDVALLQIDKGCSNIPIKINYEYELRVFFRPHEKIGSKYYYNDIKMEEPQVLVTIV